MKRGTSLVVAFASIAAAYVLIVRVRAAAPQVRSHTWAAASDMSVGRAGASATLLPDGKLLVAGGISDGDMAASAERFSPTSGDFLPTPPMSGPRANHTATLLLDGRVLVAGGVGPDGRAINSAEIYDPVANAWSATGALSIARSGHTASLLRDGRVLVAGGSDLGVATATLEIFDPSLELFTLVDGALSTPRTGHAAAAANGRVFIVGGFDGTSLLASVDVFDPATSSVAPGPSLSTARAGHSATTLLDGKVLVAGGAGPASELATAEILDPAANAFTPAGNSLQFARQNHLALLLPHNNAVLIVGGTAQDSAVAAAELYIPWEGTGGSFVPTGAPSVARAWATGAALSVPADEFVRSGPTDGVALVAGGSASASASNPAASAELYGFATITTDKYDYAPGQTVTISGSGWEPGEWVTLMLREWPELDEHPLLPVQADENGNIVSTEFSPDDHDIGILFYLTAFGTYSQAQTTFHDDKKLVVNKSGPGNGAAAATITSTTTGASGAINCGVTCSSANDNFDNGSTVTLAAAVSPEYTLVSWTIAGRATEISSGCATADLTCSFNLNNNAITVTATFTKALTVSGITAASKPYDGTTAATVNTAAGALVGVVAPDASPTLVKTGASGAFNDRNVGIGKNVQISGLTLSGANASKYTLTQPTTTADITAREITVTAATNTKTYDGTTAALATPTITSGALASGDTAAFTETYDTRHRGTGKTLTPTGAVDDGNGGANYAVSFVSNTTGVIDPRAITVAAAATSKVYDGDVSAAATPTLTSGSLAAGDTGNFTETYDDRNAGAGKTLTPSGSVADGNSGNNYTVTFVASTTGIITARAITVTASPNAKVYDGNTSAAAVPVVSAGSLVDGDVGEFTETYDDRNAGTGKTLTPAGSVSDGNGGNNYAVTLAANTDGVIQKASLTVTADDQSRPYGSDNPSLTATVAGFVGGEDAGSAGLTGAPACSTTATQSSPASPPPYPIDCTAGTLSAGNYSFDTFVSGTLTVTKAHLTVTADNQSRAYGDANPTFTATMSGFVNGDTQSVVSGAPTFTGTATTTTPASAAGSYVITPEAGTLAADNYDFTAFADGTLTITRARLTVTADDKTRQYGDPNPAFTATITGFKNDDTPDVVSGAATYTGAATTANATTAAGTYAITPAVGTLSAENYDFTSFVDGTLTISKAHLTIKADDASRIYGDPNPTFTALLTGFKNGEDASSVTGVAACSSTANASSPITPPAFAITCAPGTLAADNYDFTVFVDGRLTINARPVTVTADARTKIYGDADPELTWTTTAGSVVTGDTFSGALTRAAGEDVGDYAIARGTLTLGANYELSVIGANLAITVRPVTVAADAKTKTYGTSDPPLTYHVSAGTVIAGDSFTGALSRDAGESVGVYAIQQNTLALSSNYALSYVGASLTIGHAIVTPHVTASDKVYDGNTTATLTSRTLTGIVGSDDVTLTAAGAYFDTPSVGTNKTVTATGLALAGSSAANYQLSAAAATTTADILAWTAHGFYAPVQGSSSSSASGTTSGIPFYNVVKGGSTVPLKFELFAGANELTSTSAVQGSSVQMGMVTCDVAPEATVDTVDLVNSGNTVLRYDSLAGQFIQNWQTPNLPKKCYVVVLTANDGSRLFAYFKTK